MSGHPTNDSSHPSRRCASRCSHSDGSVSPNGRSPPSRVAGVRANPHTMTGQSVQLVILKSMRGECVSESSHTTGVWMFRTAHSSYRNRSDCLSSPQALRAVSVSGRWACIPRVFAASGDVIGLPCGPGLPIARMPTTRRCMSGHTRAGRC